MSKNSKKSLATQGGAKNPPNHGVKNPGSVGNQAPSGIGKGVIGKKLGKVKSKG